MSKTIYVVNASSRTDTGITEDLARSLAWAEAPGLPAISCVTLEDGPNGIAGAADSDRAIPAVLRFIEAKNKLPGTAGFVIACFSDPGVFSGRELTRKPVVGIAEAGYMAALSMGDLIGTIGVSGGAGGKGMRIARQLGILDRIAGHAGLGLDYGDLKTPEKVLGRLVEAGERLRTEKGAQSLLFAGAGLARYVAPLEEATGLPVIDPTQAAVAIVMGQAMQAAYRLS